MFQKISKLQLLLLISLIAYSECYKILVLAPFPVISHWLWVEKFLRELVHRGHELTIVGNFKTKQPHSNYTEIIIDPAFDIPANFPEDLIFEAVYDNDFENLHMYYDVGYATTKHALNNAKVKQLIASDDLRFDLILAEQFYQEALLMFAHKFNAPIVTLGTLDYSDFMDRAMGVITPWSVAPHPVLLYTDSMTLLQRGYNTLISLVDLYLRVFTYMPKMESLAKEHFAILEKKHGPLPSISQLEKNISLMLINNHLSTSPARAKMPGLVSVAGAHVKPPKPIPEQIKKFMDDSDDNGVILFSLGSYVQSSLMPEHRRQIFINVLGKLKQRVLWKFEDETISNLPKNIMISKWIPQSDVLAHPKLVLFISHGGMFGSQEALHRGVPVLFIPFYGDQHRNALKAKRAGYALTLRFVEVTEELLNESINEMTTNKMYTQRAKEASALFRDNPIPPLDLAMYWIEYVARYRGAPHLKSAGVTLPWYSYTLLDVFGLCIFIILLAFGIIYKIMRMVCTHCPTKAKHKQKRN